jgi:hypothetical protein
MSTAFHKSLNIVSGFILIKGVGLRRCALMHGLIEHIEELLYSSRVC